MSIVKPVSIFASYDESAYPYVFEGSLFIPKMAGGVPANPDVAEGWIRTKLADDADLIRQAVAETMLELEVDAEEAAKLVKEQRNLCRFKRTPDGELMYEGRQLKAAIKESATIAVAAGKLIPPGGAKRWGATGKGITKFVAEHMFVVEDVLPLGVTEAAGIDQRFVVNKRVGKTGISYAEYVEDVAFDFTVRTDQRLDEKQWAMIWRTVEENGVGAMRSQGWGRCVVTKWQQVVSE